MTDIVVVDLEREPPPAFDAGIPVIVVGVSERAWRNPPCDVLLPPGDDSLDAIRETAKATPMAALAYAQLLRGAEQRSIDDGLLAESAVYSALQAGPEFRAWRDSHPPKQRDEDGDPVILERKDDALHIRLHRPQVRNALNTAMRDQLVEAFDLAAFDDSIRHVHLWGDGDAFSAGGDLDEFGSFPDPATAHVVRLQQSIGRRIAALADRATAHLHGACFGSGIELPAFAGTVLAAADTTIALPELSLGLVPGAGGTVSLPRRIGRLRTAWLGLTGRRIDAPTAHRWGLVDAIS